MKTLFINATDLTVYSTKQVVNKLKSDNNELTRLIPNCIFFDNYTDAKKYIENNKESIKHIITGCTPEQGLKPTDKIENPVTNKFLLKKFSNEMKDWLNWYQSSFYHLYRIKKLKKEINFIIYSGFSQNKPIGCFDECLLNFIGEYNYVAKTNYFKDDVRRICAILKIESTNILNKIQETKITSKESDKFTFKDLRFDHIILDRPMHKLYFYLIVPYLRNENKKLHISFLCCETLGPHFISNLCEFNINFDFMCIPENNWGQYKELKNYKGQR